jgi:hypothetical protein
MQLIFTAWVESSKNGRDGLVETYGSRQKRDSPSLCDLSTGRHLLGVLLM